jgi:hypothetical protein
MIPAYSPQARGRCERSFGTWQNRWPQELRLVSISTLAQAKAFLREHYIEEFNRKFSQPAAAKGTAFRKCQRPDWDRVFSIQNERVVAKDNTVTIQDRCWPLGQRRFRNTLAGCTVTVCQHLDGRISIQWGPHGLETFRAGARRWKRRRLRHLGKLAESARFPLCPPPGEDAYAQTKDQEQESLTGQIPC